jgi:hypothetical protein
MTGGGVGGEKKKKKHIGHCTHTSESSNVKVQNIFNM